MSYKSIVVLIFTFKINITSTGSRFRGKVNILIFGARWTVILNFRVNSDNLNQ